MVPAMAMPPRKSDPSSGPKMVLLRNDIQPPKPRSLISILLLGGFFRRPRVPIYRTFTSFEWEGVPRPYSWAGTPGSLFTTERMPGAWPRGRGNRRSKRRLREGIPVLSSFRIFLPQLNESAQIRRNESEVDLGI